MIISRGSLLAVSLAALMTAGCSSSRFSSIDSQPAPLTPAPAGTVNTAQLPPPAQPATPPPGTEDIAALPPPPTMVVPTPGPAPRRSRTVLWAAIAVFAAVVGAGAVVVAMGGGDDDDESVSAATESESLLIDISGCIDY